MREADLEQFLVSRVEALGGITAKMTVMGRRGWPDRLVVLPGNAVALVELKRPKGGTSVAQMELFTKLGALGVTVMQLNSVDQITAFLNVLGEHRKLWAASRVFLDENEVD